MPVSIYLPRFYPLYKIRCQNIKLKYQVRYVQNKFICTKFRFMRQRPLSFDMPSYISFAHIANWWSDIFIQYSYVMDMYIKIRTELKFDILFLKLSNYSN